MMLQMPLQPLKSSFPDLKKNFYKATNWLSATVQRFSEVQIWEEILTK